MRGKTLSKDERYAILASFFVTGSVTQTSRELSVPLSTVSDIVDRYKDDTSDPVIARLRNKTDNDFSERCTDIINAAMQRLEDTINNKRAKVTASQLSTVIGTLYDKRALSRGESTENTAVIVKLPPEAEEYAE